MITFLEKYFPRCLTRHFKILQIRCLKMDRNCWLSVRSTVSHCEHENSCAVREKPGCQRMGGGNCWCSLATMLLEFGHVFASSNMLQSAQSRQSKLMLQAQCTRGMSQGLAFYFQDLNKLFNSTVCATTLVIITEQIFHPETRPAQEPHAVAGPLRDGRL